MSLLVFSYKQCWIINLNPYQSSTYKLKVRINFVINQKMTTTTKFQQIAHQVAGLQSFSTILDKQRLIFSLHSFKMEDSPIQFLIKAYLYLKNKYADAENIQDDSDMWNQNERRLFIWFVISYTFYLKIDPQQIKKGYWTVVESVFFWKKPIFLQFQYLILLKQKKRVEWSQEADELLTTCVKLYNKNRWNQVSMKLFYLSKKTIFRSPKHCRERWLHHLDCTKRRGEWKVKEDVLILSYVIQNGKKWAKIASLLQNTRTETMIKNRFNSMMKKNRRLKNQKEEQIVEETLAKLNQKLANQQDSNSDNQIIHQQNQNSGQLEEQQSVEFEISAQQMQAQAASVIKQNQSCHLDPNQREQVLKIEAEDDRPDEEPSNSPAVQREDHSFYTTPHLNLNPLNEDYYYTCFLTFPQLIFVNQALSQQNLPPLHSIPSLQTTSTFISQNQNN